MIKDEIKKANINAIKTKDQNARALYSVVLNKIMLEEVKLRGTDKVLNDGDVSNILQKTMKELEEEQEGFKKVNNSERVDAIEKQKSLLSAFLPKMLSESEIENIIASMEDKSVPNVMKKFKQEYNGSVDMRVVKQILDRMK